MPDLRHRTEIERELAYGFAVALHRQRRELAEMGLEDAAGRDAGDWQRDEKELAAAAYLLLRRPWEDSYKFLAGSLGLIVRPDVRSRDYDQWAVPYTQRLAGGLVATNREVVNRLNALRVEGESLTREQTQLMPLVTRNRITGIAITETTTGASVGEESAASQFLVVNGRLLLPYWQTERDEKVCPICGPLDDKPGAEWRDRFPAGPPAHPRCRCWKEWRAVT